VPWRCPNGAGTKCLSSASRGYRSVLCKVIRGGGEVLSAQNFLSLHVMCDHARYVRPACLTRPGRRFEPCSAHIPHTHAGAESRLLCRRAAPRHAGPFKARRNGQRRRGNSHRRLFLAKARPVARNYSPKTRTRPVTRTIASTAAAATMSESRGMIVIPVDHSKSGAGERAACCDFGTTVGKVFHALWPARRAPKVTQSTTSEGG
jgi:hypothetical protein